MSDELTIIAPRNLQEAKELATTLAPANTLPQALQKQPADLLAIIMTGAELGLAPMQSVRGLSIIKGKPTLSADAMGALVQRRRDICEYLQCAETTAQAATFETKRAGHPKPTRLSFTMEQAKNAGLAGGDNWKKYPDAMLRARALSAICRLVYPDLLFGVYDPDEISAEPTPPPPPVSAPPAPEKEVNAAPAAPVQSRTEAAKQQVKARLQVVDVKPGESEAEATARASEVSPWDRIQVGAKEYGIEPFTAADLIKRATGKAKREELVAADVPKVLAAFATWVVGDSPHTS